MSDYEKQVRASLLQTAALVIISIIAFIASLACVFFIQNKPFKIWLLSGVAVMAISAILAKSRHDHFVALLTPNTFATSEFSAVYLKYRKYQSIGSCLLLILAVAGVALGLYGSLI
ncbi:MAG: hypothetical protein WBH20_06560 [Oceanisphaera sp.]|uniref:hypothetical protein n=1 Tax=Oceanisphaera sp. TaxID=1929979 RepID=UPI003C7618FD